MLQKLVDFKIELNSWLHIIHPFKVFSEYMLMCCIEKYYFCKWFIVKIMLCTHVQNTKSFVEY